MVTNKSVKSGKSVKATKTAKSAKATKPVKAAKSAQAAKPVITRKQVLDYLKQNPSFFTATDSKTQEVLADIRIPHEKVPNTISLLEYQNEIWRERAEMAESSQKSILSDLQYNINVMKEMSRAVLRLAEGYDLATLCAALDKVFKEDFKVQAYKLVFFAKVPKSNLYSRWEKTSLPKELTKILDKKSLCVGELPPIVRDLFFEDDKKSLESFACMPIYTSSKKRILAVICLGSKEPERFSRDLLTDSITFMFEIIALNLEHLLTPRKK
ncbi:MAG: DUF484 family protein [Gammaproteobacteria bacterium]|nr:DUF484 family protein [Gammaproteobacteria bacterium]